MSLRRRVGALIYDWPRYRRALRSGRWELMHNRDERVFTECRTDYNRAAAFNAGVAAARGTFVVLHDNDIVVPARYAAEVAANGHDFIDIKRFIFHLHADGQLASVMQNAQGGSIAARR